VRGVLYCVYYWFKGMVGDILTMCWFLLSLPFNIEMIFQHSQFVVLMKCSVFKAVIYVYVCMYMYKYEYRFMWTKYMNGKEFPFVPSITHEYQFCFLDMYFILLSMFQLLFMISFWSHIWTDIYPTQEYVPLLCQKFSGLPFLYQKRHGNR
jgi:hypothetical protein